METMIRRTKSTDICREMLPARLAAGDPDAPGDMVRSFYPELYRYARAMLRDATLAEDIVHDALVGALEALGKYREKRIRELAIRAWLYRITLNEIRTHARKSSRRGEVQLSDRSIPVEDGGDPDGVIDALDALARLPEKQRTAVTLRHMQDLTYAEIAASTGWPENTAKTLVRRGIQRLREAMAIHTGSKEEK